MYMIFTYSVESNSDDFTLFRDLLITTLVEIAFLVSTNQMRPILPIYIRNVGTWH